MGRIVTIRNAHTGETKQVPEEQLGQYGVNPSPAPATPSASMSNVYTPPQAPAPAQTEDKRTLLQKGSDVARGVGLGFIPNTLAGIYDMGTGVDNFKKNVAAGNLSKIYDPEFRKSQADKLRKRTDYSNPFRTQEETAKAVQDNPLASAAKDTAGAASWAVPVGKGATALSTAGKFVASEGARGALGAYANDENPLIGAAGSIATGGVLKGVSKAGGMVAENAMNKLFQEPTKKGTRVALKKGEQLGAKVLAGATPGLGEGKTTTGIYNNSIGHINDLEDNLQTVLSGSKRSIPLAEIQLAVAPIIKKLAAAGDTSGVNNITSRLEALKQYHGGSVPIDVANEVKRTLYDEIRPASYGEQKPPGVEGLKQIARAFKEGIAKRVPGVDELNRQLSDHGKVADSMLEKMTKDERGKALSLTDLGFAGAAGLAANPVAGAAALVARKALGTTAGQKAVAGTAQNASKIAGNSAVQKVADIGGAKATNAMSNLFGENDNGDGSNNQPQNNASQDMYHSAIVPEAKPIVNSTEPKMITIKNAQTGETKQIPAEQASQYGISGAQAGIPDKDTLDREYFKALQMGGTQGRAAAASLLGAINHYYPEATKKVSQQEYDRKQLAYGVATALGMLNGEQKPKIGILGNQGLAENLKAKFNKGDPTTVAFNQVIAEMTASIAKARGGTSFTPNEQAMLNQYAPHVGDSDQEIKSKLLNLANKIDYMSNVQIDNAPIGQNPQSADMSAAYAQ